MRLDSEFLAPGTHLISVVGDLDASSSERLIRAIDEEPTAPRRVLDLTEMSFMDSSGLGALLYAWTATAESGGELVLVLPADAHARRTLSLRGVAQRLRVVATREEALAI